MARDGHLRRGRQHRDAAGNGNDDVPRAARRDGRHQLGIVFWYSGEWATQALNDQSGLRYDVISNNTLVDNKGSLKWDASPAHVGTTIENNVFVTAAGTSPVYLLQAKRPSAAPDIGAFEFGAAAPDDAGHVTAGDGSVAAPDDGGPGFSDENDGSAGGGNDGGGTSEGMREGGARDASGTVSNGTSGSGCSCSEAATQPGGSGVARGVASGAAFVFAATLAGMRARRRAITRAARGGPRSPA